MRLKRKAETGMQYLLKQTLLRRNQLLRRARRTQHVEFKDELHKMKQRQLVIDRWTRQAIKDERRTRREDWLCGPLAPQRDIGEAAEIYGTAGQEIVEAPEYPKRDQLPDEEIGIVENDRVVVVRGLGRGKIGEVVSVNYATKTCVVKGVRQADFPIPEWTPQAESAREKYTTSDLPIPLKDVRLIFPLVDTETGHKRDVVVRHMHFGPPHTERWEFSNLPTHTRYLSMGSEEPIELPWPEEKVAENKKTEGDTTRDKVEHPAIEFVPSPELHYVLPSASIIDELRDPYARNRASHELEFMKKKILVDMKSAWERERHRRGGAAIGTPKSEFWAREMDKRREERERRIQKGPNGETLRIIRAEMERMSVSSRTGVNSRTKPLQRS